MHINAGLLILVLAAPSLAAPLNAILKRGPASSADVMSVLSRLTDTEVVNAAKLTTQEASDTITNFIESGATYNPTAGATSQVDAALGKLVVRAFNGETAAQTSLKTFYGHFVLAQAVDTLTAGSAAGEIADLFKANNGKLPFEAPVVTQPKKSFLSSIFSKANKPAQLPVAVQNLNNQFDDLVHNAQIQLAGDDPAAQFSAYADALQAQADKMAASTSKRSVEASDDVVINSEPPVFDFSSDAGLGELN